MQHYFGRVSSQGVSLSEADIHHLTDVRRAEIGEKIEISDGDRTFLCCVEKLRPLSIKVLNELSKRDLPAKVILCFGLLKNEHSELLIQKCTELGVSEFRPFTSDRTIIKPKEKEDSKLIRMRKIAESAAKQSRRESLPLVKEYTSFKELSDEVEGITFFAYEEEKWSNSLWNALNGLDKDFNGTIRLFIGPEGGFSPKEVEIAKEKGWKFVSLGKRILRAETAGIYMSSVISSYLER